MKNTFYLKKPKIEKESLILFSCYFKLENRKFVYSTGEVIRPLFWNPEKRRAKSRGTVKDPSASSINLQLDRYATVFRETEGLCKATKEDFTSILLRDAFDREFKKTSGKKSTFFEAYDDFMEERQKKRAWSEATIKRFINIKNILQKFEKVKRYKLSFSTINHKFYTEFSDFCYSDLNHYTNTFARNVGLFKTFMYWGLDRKKTYNNTFIEFEKPKKAITREEALTLDQVNEIFNFKCKDLYLERVKDIFVFQCLTGCRYGELKLINKRVIKDGHIILKEEKDVTKEERKIPLFEVAEYILKKYDYSLPLLSNQKQNEYIKKVFENAEFTNEVEYSRTKNKTKEIVIKPFFQRVSTHTARRSFITIMRSKRIADKTIMSMTGHNDLKTFAIYHKVDDKARSEAINFAFEGMELPKLKKA